MLYEVITCGHVDIIERAAKNFGSVIVAVPVNTSKTYTFSFEQRIEFIKRATAHIAGVSVDKTDGLLVDYVKKTGARNNFV